MYNEPLTLPTDLEIIELLSQGERQTPANVAAHLDRDRRYMSDRLRNLEDRGYLRDAPPAERSGMYELTDLGAIAAFHIPKYVRNHHNIFHAMTENIHENQPENTFYPDLIKLDDSEKIALQKLDNLEGLTVPSKLDIEIVHEAGYSPRTSGDALIALYYHGLADRIENMDVYEITDRGEIAMELIFDGVSDSVELTDRLRKTYTDDEKERLNTIMNECNSVGEA